MMRLIDSFSNLYDRSAQLYINSSINDCEVKEHGKLATFHRLYIHNDNATFYLCDTKLIKDHVDTTEKMSSSLKNSTCDGVLFVYGAHNIEHLVFAELKSTYSASKLQDAFEQLIYSLLKYHRLFSLCKGYDLRSLSLDLVLACHAPHKTQEADALLDEFVAQNAIEEKTNELSFVVDILPKLQFSGTYTFKLNQLCKISSYPLVDELLKKDITLHLVISVQPEDDYAKMYLRY